MRKTLPVGGRLALVLAAYCVGGVNAQTYPAKPIRMVVPFPPGGGIDTVARIISPRLSASLGQPIVIDESGLRGYASTAWYGLLAPAKTPAPIVGQLNRETIKVLQMPETRASFRKLGAEPVGNTPDQFAAIIKAEIDKWRKVVEATGAKAD